MVNFKHKFTFLQSNLLISFIIIFSLFASEVGSVNVVNASYPICLHNIKSLKANIGSVAIPGSITGSSHVCTDEANVVYSIKLVPGATGYNWTVPSDATIVTGLGNTAISVNFGLVSGNVCVTAENACGASSQRCLFVSVSNLNAGTISSNQTICNGATASILSFTTAPSGGTNSYTYQWYNSTGAISNATNSIYSPGIMTPIATTFNESFNTPSWPLSGWDTTVIAYDNLGPWEWAWTASGQEINYERPHSGNGEAWFDSNTADPMMRLY